MNKIVVGVTASPNLKQVRSKIGSLENASYKPGGGEVKIESRKLEWKTNARCQFQQRFMSSFFVQNCIVLFFSMYSLAM
jgi:hypothetical protein